MLRRQEVFVVALVWICALQSDTAWCAPAPASLQWQNNLEEAKRIAAQTNRMVLVHFWSPTSRACTDLEKNVFALPQVQQYIDARFVPIRINADDAPTTTKRYGITQLPTDLILSPSAQILGRMACPLSADAYVQQLQIASTTPPSAAIGNGSHAAAMGGGTAPPVASSTTNPANAPTAAPPNVGYNGQWTAQKSNAAVEQAYSDSRYSEYFQRYSSAPASPQTTPSGSYASATAPQSNIAASTNMSVNVNWTNQNPAPNGLGYGGTGPQLMPPGNYAAAPSTPYATPAGPPPLGLDGYSCVTLIEQGKWQLGDRRFGAIHRGRTYLFTSAEEQQRFLAGPDRYSPTASGDDVVMALDYGQEVPGSRSYGLVYQNRIYLFTSEATEKAFLQSRDRYAAQVMQAENVSGTSVR